MHLKEIENINDGSSDKYFVNILQNIKNFTPEFDTSFDSDQQYMIMFEFGEYIAQNQANDKVFSRCMNFISDAIEKGTSITYEVLALEVFVGFYNDVTLLANVKSKLSENANIVLNYFEFTYKRNYPN